MAPVGARTSPRAPFQMANRAGDERREHFDMPSWSRDGKVTCLRVVG